MILREVGAAPVVLAGMVEAGVLERRMIATPSGCGTKRPAGVEGLDQRPVYLTSSPRGVDGGVGVGVGIEKVGASVEVSVCVERGQDADGIYPCPSPCMGRKVKYVRRNPCDAISASKSAFFGWVW